MKLNRVDDDRIHTHFTWVEGYQGSDRINHRPDARGSGDREKTLTDTEIRKLLIEKGLITPAE